MKNEFLKYEFWILSIQGAFQRSNAYKKIRLKNNVSNLEKS